MTPQQLAMMSRALPEGIDCSSGELTMMPPLMRWLVGTGRVRARTEVVHELPWQGRRVDLALLTRRGVTTAFELKIGRLQRVLEQAVYNSSSFDRSWIVTPNRPKPDGLAWALKLGIGVLLITSETTETITLPTMKPHDHTITRRLRANIRRRGTE